MKLMLSYSKLHFIFNQVTLLSVDIIRNVNLLC
jgi:hypothetical protein